MQKHLMTTFGEPLYTLKYVAMVSNTPVLMLKKWFEDGDLKSFMTIYESKSGRKYYRWGAPLYWEVPKYGHIYDLDTVIESRR